MPATTDNWSVDADGDFDTAANWSTGTVPDSNNDAVIDTASIHTITHSGGNDTVHSLKVGNDHFVLSGGSLSLVAGASFALDYEQAGGSLLGAGTVSITGNGSLTGGYAGGSLAFQIGGTIALANYTLGAAASLTNNTTVNQTGQVTLGDNTGVDATITNSSGGTYNISNDSGIGQGAVSGKFVNAGLLEKSAGNGTSAIGANVSDTGTITVATGTLEFDGATNSFGGTIGGAGQFSIGGSGASTIATGTHITTGTFGIYGNANVKLGGALSYAGNFNLGFGSTLNLNGKSLTLTGSANLFNQNFGTPTINGSGTLTTRGTTTVSTFVLGGTVNWSNSGTINEIGTLQVGDASASGATFTNVAAGKYNLTTDSGIGHGAAGTSSFVNQGTLTKTAGNGTSIVSANVVDTGTVTVKSGTIAFTGAIDSFGGTIGGAGMFVIGGGGTDTIASGTTINVAAFGVTDSGTSVTLGGDLSYAGAFSQGFGSAIHLAGHTLTLSGTANLFNSNFGTPTIDGSGTLATSGTTTMNLFILGGTVNWNNTGTVQEIATLQVGDSSANAATFTNASAGRYNLTNDSGISRGTAQTSTFVNQGTLAKTAGNGTSTVSVSIADTGTISVASGTLDFTGPNSSFGGTINGNGTFQLSGGGIDTIAAGTTISSTGFAINDGGTTVTLGGNLSYAGTFTEGQGSNVALSGFSLTLSGTATFFNSNFGQPTFAGTGKLVTSGSATTSGLNIGGTVTYQNTGTATEASGSLYIGDSSGRTAVFNNSGTYNITDNNGIVRGSSTSSKTLNSGLIEKTGGTGTSTIGTTILNSGNILVSSGRLDLQSAVNGVGTMTISGASTLQIDSNCSGQTITFGGAGGVLDLNDVADFTSKVSGFGTGDEIDTNVAFNAGTTETFTENAAKTQGTLIVTNGTTQAKIILNGNYVATGFSYANDGSGGTAITYTPPAASMAAAHPQAHAASRDWTDVYKADGAAAPTSGHGDGFAMAQADFARVLFESAFDHASVPSLWGPMADHASPLAAAAAADLHARVPAHV